ncbi:MAG: DUF2782 domain-containing protein [Gammaproteobacteria bacterium]|nr:DUF2782 domain-containing protein [Gammaproteobacteria bacterium]
MARIIPFVTLAAFIQWPLVGVAQTQEPGLTEAPEPPELPRRVQSGETLEPEVTIIRRQKETVTEYRVNGKLQAIKVEPDNAPPYYLVDSDGDGRPEARREGFGENLLVPQWVIFSW